MRNRKKQISLFPLGWRFDSSPGRQIFPSKLFFIVILGVFLFLPVTARAETVSLPMKVDYPLLTALFEENLYTAPRGTAVVLNENDGCKKVVLSEPRFFFENPNVVLNSLVEFSLGMWIGGKCRFQIHWDGSLEFVLKPKADQTKWRVNFTVIDTRVYGKDRKPAFIITPLWNLVKSHVHPHIETVTVDFSFPMREVKGFVLMMLDPDAKERMTRWLSTTRPGTMTVTENGLIYPILFDADLTELKSKPEKEPTLTPEGIDRAVAAWESWDSYLVYQISQLSESGLSDDEQNLLTAVLLDLRIQFVRSFYLDDETFTDDMTREQFMSAWHELSPIFRKHFVKRKGSSLRKLALFSAQDALGSLDKIGPTLGLEISRDGLLRLGRLLSEDEKLAPSLDYRYEPSSALRKALGLGEGPAVPTRPPVGFEKSSTEPSASFFGKLATWIFKPAWAKEELEEISLWVAKRNPPDLYLDRVRGILESSTQEILSDGKLDESFHDFFHRLVLATGWQESCWRQFIERKGKIDYLKSYNNTSVGIMQINVRVWRGIYDPEGLRWSPTYNAQAGVEILELYLRRYALGKVEDRDLLAGGVYAMYNSGPKDLKKFVRRNAENKLYKSDTLFREKYNLVGENRWDPLKRCIGFR